MSHLNDRISRERGERPLHKRFLIVCEDDKSAPGYFNALKKSENLSATSVQVFGSKGYTQPIQVVKEAIKRKQRAEDAANSGTEPFSEVWCVIDGDYGTKISNARKSAIAKGVKLAISTKCFEYWILLHFEKSAVSTMNCDAIVHTLKQNHLPGYTKGGCDFAEIVKHVREASKRAQILRDTAVMPEDQNPCSDIFKLTSAILAAVKVPQAR